MIKVSVIVPVFNIEKNLLEKCINSLLNQTLEDIEIILVDDCSTNQETIKVLDSFKNNKNIKIITHKINKKQGGARNTGLKMSIGEYIGFVDADDYIDKNMYRLLYEKAIQENSDVVDCDYFEVNSMGDVIRELKSISSLKNNDIMISSGRVWTKIYKKDILINNNILFPENMFYEDNAISGLHLLYANKISKVNKYLYYYVRHSNSTVSNASLHFKDKVQAGKIFYDTMNKRGFIKKYPLLLNKYFDIYFKSTYRLIMKYDNNYFEVLNSILFDLKEKGVDINSKGIQNKLKTKEKFEVWLLVNTPSLFKIYVYLKYKKHKVNNEK